MENFHREGSFFPIAGVSELGPDPGATLLSFLSRNALFRDLVDSGQQEILKEIIKRMEVNRFARLEPIFFKGDRASRLYVVATGKVLILLPDTDSSNRGGEDVRNYKGRVEPLRGYRTQAGVEALRGYRAQTGVEALGGWESLSNDCRLFDQKTGCPLQSVVSENYPGMVFGELGILTGQPRLATAIAAEPTTLLSLSSECFKAILQPSLSSILESKVRFFRSILAGYCRPEESRRLSMFFEAGEPRRGNQLAAQGEPLSQIWLIEQGSVALIKGNKPVPPSSYVLYGPGRWIGAIEFYKGSKRVEYSALCVENSVVHAVSDTNLKKCLGEFPEFKRFFEEEIKGQSMQLNGLYYKSKRIKEAVFDSRAFALIGNRENTQLNNTSTPQPLNPSTPQPLNPSTPQPLNPSTPQPLNPSTPHFSGLFHRKRNPIRMTSNCDQMDQITQAISEALRPSPRPLKVSSLCFNRKSSLKIPSKELAKQFDLLSCRASLPDSNISCSRIEAKLPKIGSLQGNSIKLRRHKRYKKDS